MGYARSNSEQIGSALLSLKSALCKRLQTLGRAAWGDDWFLHIKNALIDSSSNAKEKEMLERSTADTLDAKSWLKYLAVLQRNTGDLKALFPADEGAVVSTLAWICFTYRNMWAHQEPIDDLKAEAALSNFINLLDHVGFSKNAEEYLFISKARYLATSAIKRTKIGKFCRYCGRENDAHAASEHCPYLKEWSEGTDKSKRRKDPLENLRRYCEHHGLPCTISYSKEFEIWVAMCEKCVAEGVPEEPDTKNVLAPDLGRLRIAMEQFRQLLAAHASVKDGWVNMLNSVRLDCRAASLKKMLVDSSLTLSTLERGQITGDYKVNQSILKYIAEFLSYLGNEDDERLHELIAEFYTIRLAMIDLRVMGKFDRFSGEPLEYSKGRPLREKFASNKAILRKFCEYHGKCSKIVVRRDRQTKIYGAFCNLCDGEK